MPELLIGFKKDTKSCQNTLFTPQIHFNTDVSVSSEEETEVGKRGQDANLGRTEDPGVSR